MSFLPDHQYEFVCRNIKHTLRVIDDPKYHHSEALRNAAGRLHGALTLIKGARHATGVPFAGHADKRQVPAVTP